MIRVKLAANLKQLMRYTHSLLAVASLAAVLLTGCASQEQKLGRGLNNLNEAFRWGDLRRTTEQTALFATPEEGYTRGVISGVRKSVTRTVIGAVEVATFIIPSEPMARNYLSVNPVYPDNFTPRLISLPEFDTDTRIGFSGGDIAPMFPNSRFRVFNN